MDSPILTYILLSVCFVMIIGMIVFVLIDNVKVKKQYNQHLKEVEELKQKNNENSFNSNYPSYLN